jgi:hypothetical protein
MSAQGIEQGTRQAGDTGWSEVYDAIMRELAFDALREARDPAPGGRGRARRGATPGPTDVSCAASDPAL